MLIIDYINKINIKRKLIFFYCINIIKMYSKETVIYMADGTYKNIDNIRVGDKIYNKLLRPVIISRITKTDNTPVVEIQLNNGTGVFYASPSSKVCCHVRNPDGRNKVEYCSISTVYSEDGKLKNSMKILSNESDVNFTTYDDSNHSLTKTTYSIYTLDSTNSFFINNIISCCE
jgi:hypothetical protein